MATRGVPGVTKEKRIRLLSFFITTAPPSPDISGGPREKIISFQQMNFLPRKTSMY